MSPVEADATKHHATRRRRRRRVLGWLLVSLFLAAVAGAWFVERNLDRWVWGAIESACARQGLDVSVGRFEVGLSDLSVEFSDLRLVEPDPDRGRLEVEIPFGRVRLPWRYLVGLGRRRIHLAELTLIRPVAVTDGRLLERGSGGSVGGEPISLDMFIDRLQVVSGSWSHEQLDRELDLRIDGLDVSGGWRRGSRSMLGRIVANGRVEDPALALPVELGLTTRFRWRQTTIEWFDGELTGPGIEIAFDATLDPEAQPLFTGRAELSADLGRLGEVVRLGDTRFDGTARGEIGFALGPGTFSAEGPVAVNDARIDRFDIDSATFVVGVDDRSLTFREVQAVGYGGQVTGEATVALEKPFRTRVEIEGRGLDSLRLTGLIGEDLRLDSEIDARLSLDGAAGDVDAWKVSAEFDATGRRTDARGLPVNASGTVRLEQGRLVVESEEATVGPTRASVNLDIDLSARPVAGRLHLRGSTIDARATQRATTTLLQGLGIDYPELVERPVDGRGTFEALALFGGPPRLELTLDLVDGTIENRSFEDLGLSLEIDGEEVRIDRVDLHGPRLSVKGGARVRLDPPRIVGIELAVDRIGSEVLLSPFEVPFDLTGVVSGEISASEGEHGLTGSGWLSLVDGTWLGEPLEEMRADIRIERDRFHLDPLVIRSPALNARGTGVLDQSAGRASFHIEQATFELGRLSALEGRLEARVEGSGTLDVGSDGLSGRFDVEGGGLSVGGVELDPFAGAIDLSPGAITGELTSLEEQSWKIDARIDLDEEPRFEARAVLDDTRVFLPTEQVSEAWADLNGEITVRGNPTALDSIVVDGRLESGSLSWGPHTLDLVDGATVRFGEQRLEIDPFRLKNPSTDLSVTTDVDLARGRIDTSIDGTVGLELVSAVFPDIRASGLASVGLHISGPPDSPVFEGSMRVSGGRMRYLGFPHTFEQIDAKVSFRDQTASIDELRALVGGGELSGRGQLTVGPGGVESLSLDVEGTNVRVALPRGFVGIYEGRLSLDGSLAELALSGDVTMLRGLYNEEFELGSLLGGGTREYSASELTGPLAEMRLDLHVRADGNVWVRNDLAEIESFFDLRIGGTMRRPELTGRLGMLEGGILRLRDTTYRLRTGTLDFTDLDRLNPYIRVSAWTTVGSYEITLRVEGTLDALQYDLSSTPALSQQDIIALLTTGRTLQELSPEGQRTDAEFTGDLAASYFAGALTERFERQLRQALGLDVFQVNPLLINQGDPTTRLTLGKKITDDVSVIFSVDLRSTEDRLYQVEWRANRRMLVNVQRDILGGTGGNILYTDRFWWHKPDPERVKAVPAEIGAAGPQEEIVRTVGEVRIEGVNAEEREALHDLLRFDTGDPYSRSDLFRAVETIRGYYARRNRLKADVQSKVEGVEDPSAPVDVSFQIDPGPRIVVEFEGLRNKEQKRIEAALIRLWSEALFTEDIYADSVAKIREDFQDRGFYAVDASYRIREGDGELHVSFVVDRGERVHVDRVEIRGVGGIDEQRVRKQLLTRPKTLFGGGILKPETLREDVAAIRNLYTDNGYLEVRVESPQIRLSPAGDRAVVTLTIEEGPVFSVGEVTFAGTTIFDTSRLQAWAAFPSGKPFSSSEVLAAEGRLQREYDAQGYPDVRVDGSVDVHERTVDVSFAIDPGEKVIATQVVVSGNELTDEKTIRRELKVAPGETVSRGKLLRSQQALYRLGVFRNVRIDYRRAPEIGPDAYVVEVEVEEDRPLSVTTGVGWSTEAGAKFSLATVNDNVQGKARSLGVQGELSGILEQVQLLGRTPRIFGANVTGLANLLWQRSEREGFSLERRSIGLRVEHPLGRRWRGFLRYGFQNVQLLDVSDPSEVADERIEDIILGNVGIGALRSTLDNIILPTRGNYLNLNFAVYAKPLLSEADFLQTLVTEHHMWTFSNDTSFVTTFRIGFAPPFGGTDLVPVSERFFAGGDSTNRGFERDRLGPTAGQVAEQEGTPLPPGIPADQPVGGETLLLFNQEYRFPMFRKLRLKGVLFYDAGNVYFRISDFDPTDLRHTLGTGLRLETPVGPIRAEYGWKLDRQDGESAGAFHLWIGAVF